jgi:hypothetical protein
LTAAAAAGRLPHRSIARVSRARATGNSKKAITKTFKNEAFKRHENSRAREAGGR